jgi:methionine-rich copper-binding protein CopC
MNKFAKALAAAVIAISGVLPTQAAFAHAELESSNPEANSVIGAAPAVVALTFGEKLLVVAGEDAANQIEVVNSANEQVDNADYQVTGEVLTVSLQPNLADDNYKITYRVVSTDGHPIEGVIEFEVSAAARSGEATPMPIAAAPEPTLYEVEGDEAPVNGAVIGISVAVGALVVAAAMFFLFRRLRGAKSN